MKEWLHTSGNPAWNVSCFRINIFSNVSGGGASLVYKSVSPMRQLPWYHGACMSAHMSRRQWLAATTGVVARAQTGARRPNVLFIAVDDLNDWVGAFGGHPQSRTPNIDRLAARGVRFDRAYCQAPLCNPARASLLTGLRPTTTGIYDNDQAWRDGAAGVVTLPEYFRANGYHVAGAGKIFHASQTDYSAFDEYFKTPAYLRPEGARKEKTPGAKPAKDPAGGEGKIQWGAFEASEENEADTQVAKWSAGILGRAHGKPLFLACGFIRPHLPWFAARKYFERFPPERTVLPEYLDHDLDDVPRSAVRPQAVRDHERITGAGKWKEAVAAYLACVNYADECVGRLMAALDNSRYRDNTIVVLWGDHGWHLGEKRHWRKFTLWERSCRAPLTVMAPGVTRAGGVCRRPVEFLDLYPTLADLCGLPANPKVEGRSIRPLLANPDAPWDHGAITSNGPDHISVRTGRWRYTRHPDGEELYDHNSDPNEWTNLASRAEHRPLMRDLAALLPRHASRKELRHFDKLPESEKARLRGRA